MITPSLHGNWIDLAIILIILYYLWGSFNRGFLLGLVDLLGFLLTFAFSLKFYSPLGELLSSNFSLPKGISNAFGFLLVGIITETTLSSLINLMYTKAYPKLSNNKRTKQFLKVDKLFGFLPRIGEAVILIAFLLTLLVVLPIQGSIKKDILDSKLGSPLVTKSQQIEGQINSIFTPAINETLTFITINPNPSSNEKIDLHFTTTDVKTDETAENIMLDLVNQERQKAGIKKLVLSTSLKTLARNYGKEMFAQGYFAHNNPSGQSPFDRMKKAEISFNAAGENLALAPNVNFAHQGLMKSPGHKANILSPDFAKVGIGVIDGGIYGEMFVQEFTD